MRHGHLLKVDRRNDLHTAEGVKVFQPLIERHAVGVKVVEHHITDANSHMPPVLGDGRLPAVSI
jgi:hypothetical protein